MVLVTDDRVLEWSEIEPIKETLRRKALDEFVHVYNKFKHIKNDPFKWGDEMELSLIKFDHDNKRVHLLLRAEEFFAHIKQNMNESIRDKCEFHNEFTSYMIETIPGEPLNDDINSFLTIEDNMKLRRKVIQDFLGENEHVISLTCFPMLGCDQFTTPYHKPKADKFGSIFISDEVILDQMLFKIATMNKNERRHRKPLIYAPVFVDSKTPRPFLENLAMDQEKLKPDFIYMDHDGFGMGCCCIQVTFQADSLQQACVLYDQLTTIAPIVLSLSAASPVWRGYLSGIDCRWSILKQAMDDRTREELGQETLDKDKFRINTSRFDTTDVYLSHLGRPFNDFKFVKDEKVENFLLDENVDELVAQHYASMFVRDPYVVLSSDLDRESFAGNFETFNCTNWRLLRFKPPPLSQTVDAKNKIGWRVEFRPTEIQFTDFENAALATFIILLTKAIIKFDLNFLVDITRVGENVERAQKMDACRQEKFYFRQNINDCDECCLLEMSLDEIVNGCAHFKGLLPIIKDYLDLVKPNDEARAKIESYLKLIEQRANGGLLTPAAWIRKFIREHPAYEHNSKINHEINYDLIKKIHELSTNEFSCSLLLPTFQE